MTIHIGERIGDGGYGHVYKGHDDALNREVAIKFIYASAGDEDFTKEQARALSRCQSQNVVTVYSLEELDDPETKTKKLALVMELVPGSTVLTLMAVGRLTLEEVRRIGLGTINGLDDIHSAELVHRDLKFDNVMASPRSVKIIDILYKHTLAGVGAESGERLRRDDRNALREFLTQLIWPTNPTQADVFTNSLRPDSTLRDIRNAFDAATDPKLVLDIRKLVEHFLRLINEETYEDSVDYASVLSEEIPDALVVPLFEAIIANGGAPKKRSCILDILWNRLGASARSQIGAKLSEAITREVPDGTWMPHILMLRAFGRTGWLSLTRMCRMRLENALIADVRRGFLNTRGVRDHKGQFGIWSTVFYDYFTNKEALLDAIVDRLRVNWYTQNYVAESYMRFLHRLVKKPEDRERLIDGLAAAVRNNAFGIKENLSQLPEGWPADVEAKVKEWLHPTGGTAPESTEGSSESPPDVKEP